MKQTFLYFAILSFLAACNYTQKIRDGKTAFEHKQFAVATKYLPQEFQSSKSRLEKGKIALMLAQSYRTLHRDEEAARWFKTAHDNAAGTDALREYALALKRLERYDEAIEVFKQLGIEVGSPYEYRREITACNQAKGWLTDTIYAPFVVENAAFNSAAADYALTRLGENILIFSSDRTNAIGEKKYEWTGNQFSDLFSIEKEGNKVNNFSKTINSVFNEATPTFSADGKLIVFTRCGEKNVAVSHCKLFFSEKNNTEWSEPEPLPFLKDKINYGTPALSADGKLLIFAANDPEGWGGYDLYTVERRQNGEWGDPRIMSRTINTVGNEIYPTIDGDTLYFSSDFQVGMGGLDIFKTYKMREGKTFSWASPRNMLPPINSGADDFAFVPSQKPSQKPSPKADTEGGYFTSNRVGGRGNDDIYRFSHRTPKERPAPPVVVLNPNKNDSLSNKPKEIKYKIFLDIFVVEKIFEQNDNPNSRVMGKKPLANALVKSVLNGKKWEQMSVTEGGISVELKEETDYQFTASLQNYFNASAKFSTKGIGRDPQNPEQRFELEIVLDKIYKEKEITLENIYYDYDKSDIREDAKPTLNKLAEMLRQNPLIKIQLSSHTDCRGNDTYNQNLSQRRAESAVNYLISLGIETSRLAARGYGESLPAVSCDCRRCTESEHQANRRTTFKVIE